jgi:tetratricopeptide (TPR) repeat protein
MLSLSRDLLGLSPDDVGDTSGKGAFARALVERCLADDSIVALADAMSFAKKDVKHGDVDLFARADELAPGTMVGAYKIAKKVGEGGTGVVYLADKGEEKVALKALKSAHARDRATAQRWATAMRAVAHIDEPTLGRVVGVGTLEDGRPWAATRFVEGQALGARIARTGPMHFNEARPILRGVLSALEALHARGLAHGNVKMENVFVIRPTADGKMTNEPTGVLVDAAADRLLVRRPAATASESGVVPVAGSAKAFAPEQAKAGQATTSSDVYAFGALMFEVLTGKPPFSGSAIDVVAQHLTKAAEAPSTVAPRGWVSKEVDAIALRALEKDPTSRYRSVTELREAIESIGRASIPPEARKKESLDQSAFDRAVDALAAEPASEELAAALERIADPAEEWSKAAEKLREVAGLAEETDAKKSLLFRAARLLENDAKDDKAAEECYRDILALDANEEIARIGLEELKRRTGDGEGLAELLLEKVERETDPGERASILRDLADTYETRLKDEANAFVAWTQALTEDPKDDRAAREISRLATGKNERWNEAIHALNEAAQAETDPSRKVVMFVLMGTWYGERIGRPDFALPCFSQALAIDPHNEGALDGTVALYRKAQSFPELAGILLRRAETTRSPLKQRDYKAEAAEIVMRKLGDSARAQDLFEQVLASDPAHPRATEALETIYGETKRWPELAKLLERKAASQRGATRIETLSAIAELYEDRLGDPDRALAQYEAVVADDARNVAALKGLERIYVQKGLYDALLANLRVQLETVATPRQRISLLERIGGILEEEFVDHKRAAEAFEEIVAIEPGHEGANTQLGHLYRRLQRFDDLAKTLERHALGSQDEPRKISLLLQAARVLTVDVGAPQRAMQMAERVLGVAPNHSEALELLARLQHQTGDAKSAIDSVRKLADAEKDGPKKAELYVRVGKMLEDAGDKDGAIAQYKAALDANHSDVPAAAALRSIYAGRGDAHGAAELLSREIESTSGSVSKAKLLAELGAIRLDRLKDVAAAKDAYKKALELDATNTPAARGLGDIAFDAGEFEVAGKYFEPLLARTSEMSKDDARAVSLRAGDAFRNVNAFDKAQRAYLNAKAFAPDDREVLERLAEVTFDAGAADEAAEMYRDILKTAGKDLVSSDRGRIVYRVGEALRRSGQLDEARTTLEEATQLLPGQAEPLHALKLVYEAKSDWEKVVSTLKRRIDVAPDDERVRLLVEQGDVLIGKVADKQRAGKAYVAALEIRADDRNLLTKLMAVYSETKDWSKLVEVILRIAELVSDKVQLGKYYNTAAAISHLELGRLDEAADYYEQALDMVPTLSKAFEGLVAALTSKADWPRLEKAYRARIRRLEGGREGDAPVPGVGPKDLSFLYDSLAELYKHRLGRPGDAVEAFEKAQKLEPENRRRAEQLAEIFAAEPKKYFTSAVRVHRELLELSPYRMESYQALRKLYTEAKKPDESWCVCQTLTMLKNAEPDEEAFFKKHRKRSPAAIKSEMTDELWHRHLVHPTQDPLLTDIFAVITPAVIATRAQPLAAFKLGGEKPRDAERDAADMARTLWYAGAATRIPLPPMYYRNDDPGGLSFVFAEPPSIGLGRGAQQGGPAQALAFVAGRHLSFMRGGLYLRQLVPTGSGLRGWLLAAIKSVVPAFPVPGELASAITEHQNAFKQHLSMPQQDTLRSHVTKLLQAAPELDLKKWTAAVDLTADRVGFVLANDLEIAAALVRASPDEASAVPQKDRLKELTLFSVSESYFTLRHKLGVAIGD